jgi:hypothetical protein
VNKNRPYVAETELKDIADRLRAFLGPIIQSLRESRVFQGSWSPTAGWKLNS